MRHTMYENFETFRQNLKSSIHSLMSAKTRFLQKQKLKKHTNIQQYIIQQSEKRFKKGHVDARFVELLYGSRNPGNLPGLQDLIIYRIRFRLISMYDENPDTLPSFSYIKTRK